MKRPLRIAAIGAAVALAACGDDDANLPGLLLSEPSAVATFRGLTTKHGSPRHPYLAIANAGANDLTVIDARDNSIVLAPVPLRALVVPVPGRPALLASADLGDDRPDLLVAVSAGDSRLQIVRTWTAANAVASEVDLGADVLAIAAVPSEVGKARIAAALVGRRIAVVEFARQAGGDGIEPLGDPRAAAFDFQAIALAALPDDPAVDGVQTRLYAASRDEIQPGLHGVAELDVPAGGAPGNLRVLDANAPTRLVTAARLLGGENVGAPALDATAFTGPPVERVYAVLDEAGCGLAAPIACGLVALDPGAGGLPEDPAGELPHRAPLPIPGGALALASSGPPAVAPDPAYGTTLVRVVTAANARATTGVAAVASANGAVYFVDLGRWELPSEQPIQASLGKTVTSGTTAADQWLVLFDPDPTRSTTVVHGDATGLANAVTVTAGYTPTARWTVTYQGALPGLSSRRAHAPGGPTPLLALQVPGSVPGGFTEIVRLHDPTLGVRIGDRVVIEPTALGTCAGTFEAEVEELVAPASGYPGGAVGLRPVASEPSEPAWAACVAALADPTAVTEETRLRASFLAGGYVLVQGSGSAALHVGRPVPGTPFEVAWSDEAALAASCTLPPAVPWSLPAAPCEATCRTACEALVRARLARRIGYVSEPLPAPTGPALRFTLALETTAPPPRGLTLTIDTNEGRAPFRVGPPGAPAVEPRSIAAFDRSREETPEAIAAGVRFFVPYAGGIVVDATPTLQGGNAVVIR